MKKLLFIIPFFALFGCRRDLPKISRESAPLQKMTKLLPSNDSGYIITLKSTASPSITEGRNDVTPIHTYTHSLKGFSAHLSQNQVDRLKNDPDVLYVEKDGIAQTFQQTLPPGVNRVEADLNPFAHIDGVDNPLDVDIAILDTGVDSTHQDLRVAHTVNFATSATSTLYPHATHVAGIAAAKDNGIGVVGVAPGARIWSVRVLDQNGYGYWSDIIAGIDYITSHASEIEVVNCSLGGQGQMYALHLAIQNCVNAGVVFVAAAGNSSVDVYGNDGVYGTSDDIVPASYPEVMTVSAMVETDGVSGGIGSVSIYGEDDQIATFSNKSMSVISTNPVVSTGKAIDVAEPGVDVLSTLPNNSYGLMSGTSMACPHASGLVALYCLEKGRAHDANGVYRIRQAIIDASQYQSVWRENTNDPDGNKEGLGIALFTNNINRPIVTITSPSTNPANIIFGSFTTFSATARDNSGDLSGLIVWNSDFGPLGTGSSISLSLPRGDHQVSATVENSEHLSGSAAVSAYVYTTEPFLVPRIEGVTALFYTNWWRAIYNTNSGNWPDYNIQSWELWASYSRNGNGGWSAWEKKGTSPYNVQTIDFTDYHERGYLRLRLRCINPFNTSPWSAIYTINIKTLQF